LFSVPELKPLTSALYGLRLALNDRIGCEGISLGDLIMMKICYCVLSNCDAIWDNCNSYCQNNAKRVYLSHAMIELIKVLKSTMKTIGEQQVWDLKWEIQRLQRVSQLEMVYVNLDLCPGLHPTFKQLKRQVMDMSERYTTRRDVIIQQMLHQVHSILLTTPTARPIREVMLIPLPPPPKLAKGNWFKCETNDHVYLVTDRMNTRCLECV
jgi:hypothetical protein